MRTCKINCQRIAIITAIGLITACGGGGGGDSSGGAPQTSVSGVASAGAPIADASITVLSSNGQYYSPSSTTGTDGSFSFQLPTASYPTPFLVQVNKATGQSIGTYYSFVSGSDATGLVITPLSNAVVALAANSNLDQIFDSKTIPATLSNTRINTALQQVSKALSNQLTNLAITNQDLLLKNPSYVANGLGQDSILDSISVSSASAVTGSVLLSSKLSGTSVQIDNGSTTASINTIPFSSNSSSLLQQITSKIEVANTCIKNAINTGSSTTDCIDATYLHEGENATQGVTNLRTRAGAITYVGKPSVIWCLMDDAGLTLESTSSSLASKSGKCYSSFEVTATNGSGVLGNYYKFTVNGGGTTISDLKAYGNQLNATLQISPRITVKSRVDGFTNNTGVTSGYGFQIGTALQQTGGNPTILPTSNLSAKVEILNSTGGNISTFYMQCQQDTSCINTELSICVNASSTCADGVTTTTDNVLSVNSALSSSIMTAMQSGFVSAKVTAYNKVLSDNSKTANFVKTIPIVGLPLPQSDAEALTYPTLTDPAALRDWAGGGSLSISLDRGSSKLALKDIEFQVQPSAGGNSISKPIGNSTTSVTFTGITHNTQEIIPITPGCSTHAQSSGAANWRALYISALTSNIPVDVKIFGSCFSGDY